MAPKLSSTQIDAKLADLRKFVEENLEIIGQRRGTTLAKSLRKNQSADERKWYMFLTKKISDFTAEQSEHLKQTFALLGTPSNAPTAGVPPSSSNEAMDMNDASGSQSRSGVPPATENARRPDTLSTGSPKHHLQCVAAGVSLVSVTATDIHIDVEQCLVLEIGHSADPYQKGRGAAAPYEKGAWVERF